ncbi:MAG: ABC transporter permease, partial [Variovorax paradoxus]|nr:ABC transporter permease [Variovorax paradoxus]
MAAVPSRTTPAERDPAWAHRVFWLLAAAVVLWPMLVLT